MSASENIIYDTEACPYLLFSVGKNVYGISSKFVRSIETLGEVTTIAENGSTEYSGVIYQNNFIPLINMRKLFGLDSQIEEFEKAVQPDQRIKDHENWVAALEKSVRDRTDFKLTDDPHQCAFGKWFYSFKTDDNVLKHRLNAIEAPHEAVHSSAKVIKKLMQDNKYDLAMAAVDDLKATHYKTTLSMLSTLRETVADSLKELYIVIDTPDCMKGILVDAIVGVEHLKNTLQVPESMPYPQYVEFLGQRKNDNKIIIVLNNSL